MTLVLRNTTRFTSNKSYEVTSGSEVVGYITFISGGPNRGRWIWQLTPLGAQDHERYGVEHTLRKAMRAFEVSWCDWLRRAGLSEIDAPLKDIPVNKAARFP